jgi:hypothetical protein
VFAVDASTMERCEAETSPERGFYYHASKHSAGQPIVAGWSYQWITQLNWAKDSWTAPMDARRLHPCETASRPPSSRSASWYGGWAAAVPFPSSSSTLGTTPSL